MKPTLKRDTMFYGLKRRTGNASRFLSIPTISKAIQKEAFHDGNKKNGKRG